MKMPRDERRTLRDWLSADANRPDRFLLGFDATIDLGRLLSGSCLSKPAAELRGRSALLATGDQLTAAVALIELDGMARRIVLCPPDLPQEHVSAILDRAEVDAIVSDRPAADFPPVASFVACDSRLDRAAPDHGEREATEWILLTSGTTGVPKMVAHSLASLTGAFGAGSRSGPTPVWSTFYDIRRYGGLQILLRAVFGGGSMVLSDSREPVGDFLIRAGGVGVTHISGTPSHWRRALMSPSAHRIAPHYVRLSGEIADQSILDHLSAAYPRARIGHAFASTEAGVAFAVDDGLAGFPESLIGRRGDEVELEIADGSLRIRSARTAAGYLGSAERLADADGYVDTGDMIERRGDRCYFVGRRGGIINVGGCKVHPEEVEAVINRHPGVRMSLVKARRNPITGAIVVADVVAETPLDPHDTAAVARLQAGIIDLCRGTLAAYKVPATIRFVPALAVGPSGKLVRLGA